MDHLPDRVSDNHTPGPSIVAASDLTSQGNIVEDLMRELGEIQSAADVSRDYKKTLALLRALKAGTVSLDNVAMTDVGWALTEIEPPVDPPIDPPEQIE